MRLTIPGQEGYHPQVGGNDPVTDGGKVDDSSDVSLWLLNSLSDIHDRARQINSDHLASISAT